MALVKYGQGVAQMSGSIGGTTYSRNASGAYARNRSIPVNPNTARQQGVRNNLSALVDAWSADLTEVQREQWRLYAANVSVKNRLGDDIFISGFNMFVRSNTARLQLPLGAIDDGPGVLTLPGVDEAMVPTVSEATQEISIAFNDALEWVDEVDGFMSIFMSQPKSGGTKFVGGPYRFAGFIQGDITVPPTTPQTFPVPFPVTEGQQITVQARIGRGDGRLSTIFQTNITVSA